jgi:hypothetical protein
VSGVGCRVSGVGCRVSGVGCRVSGVGCRVSGWNRQALANLLLLTLPADRLCLMALHARAHLRTLSLARTHTYINTHTHTLFFNLGHILYTRESLGRIRLRKKRSASIGSWRASRSLLRFSVSCTFEHLFATLHTAAIVGLFNQKNISSPASETVLRKCNTTRPTDGSKVPSAGTIVKYLQCRYCRLVVQYYKASGWQ